jgi:molybdopterin converting factor subunit 1
MKIQVLLFAQARQIVGSDSIEVTIPDAATVADLKNSLSDSVPELTALLSRSNIALDQQYAIDEDVVSDGVEVALIPPVSGG